MFRKTWRHVRLLGRLTAWSAGSLGCLFALYHAASGARGLVAPYTSELSETHILFGWLFCPLSILVLIWIWPSFVRRSLSIDSSWLKILRTFVAVLICLVGVGLGIAVATGQDRPLWTWVLLAAAAGSLICLVIPRMVLSFLRPNVFSRDVLSLNLKLRAVVAARCVIGIVLVLAISCASARERRQTRSRLNLAAIRVAELAYFSEFGTYMAADPHPKNAPGYTIGIPGAFAACPSIGAYDRESGQYRLRWMGPCDEKSAQTVF